MIQREPGAEKVVELNFHVAVGAMAEHEDSAATRQQIRESIVRMDHPSIVLAAKLSLDPIEHRLSLTGARAGKGAKPVRALSLLLIILSTLPRPAVRGERGRVRGSLRETRS